MIYSVIASIIEIFEKTAWYIKRKALYKKLGNVGQGVYISRGWSIPSPKNIHIGDDVYLGENARLSADCSDIYIGNHVMFGPNVHVHGGDHRHDVVGRWMNSITLSEKRPGIDDQDVHIEDEVWIGDSAIVLKGVTIARGCIIGAGAIISKSTQPYDIVVGVNKVIGKRFTDEEIAEHEAKLYK